LYLDGVILDEYADIHPRVFDEIIRPLLSDRHGWAVFIGTPCGHDAFYDTYQKALVNTEDWYSIMLKASTSGILDPDEMEAMKKEMSEDAYAQELECSFEAAIKGAVFGKEMQVAEADGRITTVPWDPGSEVWTGWDLGIGDATAIWFCQQVGREPRLIDFYQARGASIDHYVKILKEKPYAYARHLLPHDADKTELGSGQSIIEQLKGMGIRNTRVVKKLTISERIEIGRKFVRMCWFDRKKCHDGVEALKVWRYEYDALAGVNSKKPIHNWASHPSDAFTYLAVGFKPESMYAAPIKYPNLAIP
jgi:phage terminase large subunit